MIDKYAGCLIGVAVGDALGAPLEEIPNHSTSVQRPVTEMIGGGWLKLLPGQITDDTEMTLCLARSLVEKKSFDPKDIAEKFTQWYTDSPIGAGGTTRRSLERFREGAKWYLASDHENALKGKGNGTVMRCSPVALFDYANLEDVIDHTHKQSLITHRHPDCWDSAIFLNIMINLILDGRAKRESFDHALDMFRNVKSPFDYANTRQAVAERFSIIPALKEFDVRGEVKATVETAVYCFLKNDSFETTILEAINMGGDSDTRGAVVGALAGAYYGEKNIPERWKSKLVDRHGKPIYQELGKLSGQLLKLSNFNMSTYHVSGC